MTVTDDEMIEAMARAMLVTNCERLAFPYPWDDLDDEGREQYRAEATAALDALRPLLARREQQAWQPIATAPKSLADGSHVHGVYLLGFCPDEGAGPEGCFEVIWWEPLVRGLSGKLGCWFGQSAIEARPTHWMPLPPPPAQGDEP